MGSRLKNAIALSLLPQIILVKWWGSYPGSIEKYYSNGFYPKVSKFFRYLFGWVPFSVGDVLYTLLVLLALGYLVREREKIIKHPFTFIRNGVMVLSVAYFTFHMMWGLNYYRVPISQKFNVSDSYTQEDLLSLVKKLTLKTNQIHYEITSDTTQAVSIPYSKKQIFEKTLEGFDALGKRFPFLTYAVPSLKESVYSLPLTYMGYGGYLNPFTNEAQVNGKLPLFRYPVVCGHEIGHQLGYSAENETNFIGYLVTVGQDDIYFKYAAYAYALSYCLGELRVTDEDQFNRQYATLHQGVKKNYEEMNNFWMAYENPMEPLFKSAFDIFLKSNNQTKGIMSYNSVVSLYVNYYKVHPL
jgi:hypothetical protein